MKSVLNAFQTRIIEILLTRKLIMLRMMLNDVKMNDRQI